MVTNNNNKKIENKSVKNILDSSSAKEYSPDNGSINNGIMKTKKVLCIKEQNNSEFQYYSVNKKACEWSRRMSNTKTCTCSDCEFGIQVLDLTPAKKNYKHDWETRLSSWKWSTENLQYILPIIKKNNLKLP